VKLGVLTAAFPTQSLDDVATWAAGAGFDSLEVACWPAASSESRRYGGVSHLDVESLQVDAVHDLLERTGLTISALAYYPNPLHPDPEHRERVHTHLRKVVDAASRLGVATVGTFIGNDRSRPMAENVNRFRQIWPDLVAYAGERDVNIAIENCPMLFSADEWPGGENLAWSPAVWDEIFGFIPDANFGLNLDPSHLVWLQIDYVRVVEDYAQRILHCHAKDLEIDREGLYRHGTLSGGIGWQRPRLPGLGEVDWTRFLSALYRVGYTGTVSIEHEDRAFEGDVELVKRGFLIARDTLRPLVPATRARLTL
jgi:sugar phosphate isomerase/epimerase